jgi:hypothetical protein
MKTYNWKIQLSEFYSDQFEDKGSVDKEKAIEAFQFFPWDKELDDFKRRNDNPTVPRIIFNSPDNRVLDISSVNLKGFNVEYNNIATKKYSAFYISNDFDKKNWTIEELIEFFFDNSLEEHIKLENILDEKEKVEKTKTEKRSSKNIEFAFNPKHIKTLGFSTFMLLGLSITFLTLEKIKGEKLPILIHFLFLLSWLPSFILHLTYFQRNNRSKVIIDVKNHDLTFIKGETEIKFNREDIFRALVTTVDNSRLSWANYSYVWFILKDKRQVTITCFIDDPYKIVEMLNCKFEHRTKMIPILP